MNLNRAIKSERNSPRPPIAILFDTSCKAGRDRIAGALDFIARFTDWEPFLIQLQSLSPAEISKEFLRIRPRGCILQCKLPPGTYPMNRLANIPVVTIDGYSWTWEFEPDVRIRMDEQAIGKAAAFYFRKRDFESAAYIGSMIKSEMPRSLQRGKAFETAFAGTRMTCRFHQPEGFSIRDRNHIADFLATLPTPCGVFTYSDSEAALVVNICRKLKYAVPHQISVLGVDNNESVCEADNITTSSILPDFRGCGYASAQSLYCLLNGTGHTARQQIQSFGVQAIIERKSTLNVGAAHRLTAQIKRYISAHLTEKISIPVMVTETGVSLRMMEKIFRGTTGHCIRDEIKKMRLRTAAALLAEKSNTMADVAWKSGLGTSANLCILFKRQHGVSPTAWRKANAKTFTTSHKDTKGTST